MAKNDKDIFVYNTGGQVTKTSNRVQKATGDIKSPKPGFAKAAPAFKDIKPSTKAALTEEEKEKILRKNEIKTAKPETKGDPEKDKDEEQDSKNQECKNS